MTNDCIEIPWDSDDLNVGAYEQEINYEYEFRVIVPRSGVSATIRDEGVAVAMAVKLVAAEVGGGRIRVLDPTDFSPQARDLPQDACRIRMQRYVRKASLVIIVGIGPSSAMGAENELRGYATIPCMLIARKGIELGAAFESRLEPTISTIRYETLEGLIAQLRIEIRRILIDLKSAEASRQKAYKAIGGADIPPFLFFYRLVADLTVAELARRTSICEADLRELERDPEALAHRSYLQLHRIADALTVDIEEPVEFQCNPNDGPRLYGNQHIESHVSESLNHLYTVLRDDRKWIPCEIVLKAWQSYKTIVKFGQTHDSKELSTAEARQGERDGKPVKLIWGRDDWIKALERASGQDGDGMLWQSDID